MKREKKAIKNNIMKDKKHLFLTKDKKTIENYLNKVSLLKFTL